MKEDFRFIFLPSPSGAVGGVGGTATGVVGTRPSGACMRGLWGGGVKWTVLRWPGGALCSLLWCFGWFHVIDIFFSIDLGGDFTLGVGSVGSTDIGSDAGVGNIGGGLGLDERCER